MIRIKPSRREDQLGLGFFLLVLLISGAVLHLYAPNVFPWPTEIGAHLWGNAFDFPKMDVLNHWDSVGYLHFLLLTTLSYVTGIAIGVSLFYVLAIGILFSPRITKLTRILIDLLRVAPPLILIPVIYALIPRDFWPPTAPAVSAFPITNVLAPALVGALYIWATLSLYLVELDPRDPRNTHIERLYELSALLSLPKHKVVRHIYLRSLLPDLVMGLRNSTWIALSVIFVAEFQLGPIGLGFIVRKSWQSMDMLSIYGAITLAILLTLLFDIFYSLLHRHIRRHYHFSD